MKNHLKSSRSLPYVRVVAPARLHFTLIDMNGESGRVDGSVGLAIESPQWEIEIRPNRNFTVVYGTDFETRILREFFDIVKAEWGLKPAEVRVVNRIPFHVGLGARTQLALAYGAGHFILENVKVDIRDIAKTLGRGGTSGIGIGAFEVGGFVVDGGHNRIEKGELLPSSACRGIRPPPLIACHSFPSWPIVIVWPKFLRGISGSSEIRHFNRITPLPLQEVERLSHLVLMRLLPAVADQDFKAFCCAINDIQSHSWKRAEIATHGSVILDIMQYLIDQLPGAGVAMSSMGPAFAVFYENPKVATQIINSYCADRRMKVSVFTTKGRNEGAIVQHASKNEALPLSVASLEYLSGDRT